MADISSLDTPVETTLAGYELIHTPMLNKGTAFTEPERDLFRLHGLLPPVSQMRAIAGAIAKSVAHQAQADGVADPCDAATLDQYIEASVWEPQYRPYRKAS